MYTIVKSINALDNFGYCIVLVLLLLYFAALTFCFNGFNFTIIARRDVSTKATLNTNRYEMEDESVSSRTRTAVIGQSSLFVR